MRHLVAVATLSLVVPGLAGAASDREPPPIIALEPLWDVPAPAPGKAAEPAELGALAIPPNWSAGDAAAVVLRGHAANDPLWTRLSEALLNQGAAVVMLGSRPADGVLQDLLSVLMALRRDYGAGILVALGAGDGAAAAMNAVREEAVAQRLGPAGPRLAAVVAFGRGLATFRAGTKPAPAERWPDRVAPFCGALAQVLAGTPPARPSPAVALETTCIQALLSGGGHASGQASAWPTLAME